METAARWWCLVLAFVVSACNENGTRVQATGDAGADAEADASAALTADASATDAPPMDAQATDAPATDVSATDAPATDASATDASATDASATDASATDANGVTGGPPVIVDDDGGAIVSITVSPLPLTPAFSPTIDDYYVRCAAGNNAITLNIKDQGGTQSIPVDVVENQAIVVAGQYWIRCLPHDFPAITVTRTGTPTPGYYLANAATYAIAFDTNGTPVWYEQGPSTANVDAPAADTISFSPNATAPFGLSPTSVFEIDALDVWAKTNVTTPDGPTDPHELRVLENGDYMLFTYPIESGVDLTGLQSYGANQTIADCEIEEIGPSGNVVWSWLASDHVDAVKESLEPAQDATVNGAKVVDVFHCNSIDVDASGNLLLSMRHANAVFYIDRTTGQITWKLGGASYNKDGAAIITVQNDPETTFSMQHDARFQDNGDISMFDDHGAGNGGVARGVQYAIDHTAGVATVDWQYLGTAQSQYEGSCRRYSDGESVIGWGYIPTDPRIFTEVDENGNDVFDIALAGNNPTYRAVKVATSQLNIDVLRAAVGK